MKIPKLTARTALDYKLFPRRFLSKKQWFCNVFEVVCAPQTPKLVCAGLLEQSLPLLPPAEASERKPQSPAHTSLGVQSAPTHPKTIAFCSGTIREAIPGPELSPPAF